MPALLSKPVGFAGVWAMSGNISVGIVLPIRRFFISRSNLFMKPGDYGRGESIAKNPSY